MESERTPLSEQPGNKPSSKLPTMTKLPTPGQRRIPQPPGLCKRKLPGSEEPAEKKAKVGGFGLGVRDGGIRKPGAGSRLQAGVPAPKRGMMRRSMSTSALNKLGPTSILPGGRTKAISTRKPLSSVSGGGPSKTGSSRPPTGRAAAVASKPAASKPTTGGGKKRPAWDLKGRLADMESAMSVHLNQNNSLQAQLSSNSDRVALLEQMNQQLEGTVQQKEQINMQVGQQIQDLQRKLRESEEELLNSTRKQQREIEDLHFSKSTLERQKSSLEAELSASQGECAGLKSTVGSITAAQAGLKAQLENTELNLKTTLDLGRMKDQEIAELRAIVARHEATMAEMEDKMREHEMTRRKLHNTIQELKGNIRVFCRVRPLLGEECLGNDGMISHITFLEDTKTLELEKLADQSVNESTFASMRKGSNNRYEFSFDRVFQPTDTQATVFDEISQLVQSALDGFNVCIFAYGQTGSGKTHTMEGPVDKSDFENQGMIPRAVHQIFQVAQELQDKAWQYGFEASFMEIYNETIRDLLGNDKDNLKHEIKMVAAHSSEVMATNMTSIKVLHQEQVHNLLLKASENRAVAETKCNERSSRSHSVFRLRITGHNTHTDERCTGELNLIDLAGSERLKESGSQGARLKETQSINKSLANLGNVIMALANKDPHIPYRNSKLTHLLQHSLGGNSKTLMFVNVSPKEECFGETLNSLRFATKVNNCMIGTATKKVK